MSKQGSAIKSASSPRNSFDWTIRPAVRSNFQAGCLLLLVVLILALPVLLDKSGRLSRRDSYDIMPENLGPYSFVAHEVFDNNQNVDLLFLGNSYIFVGIDTPQVEAALSEKLKRPARVVTFGSEFAGMDIPYVQLRDFLERKRAGMVMLSIPRVTFADGPNPVAFRFLRFGEYTDTIRGLPLKYRVSLYAANVLRSPHDLLTLIRRNMVEPSPYSPTLGASRSEVGWYENPGNFKEFTPPAPPLSASDLIYTAGARDKFQFSGDILPPYQHYFLEKIVGLLASKQIPLAVINIPQYSERYNPQTTEREQWAKSLGAKIPLLGISPRILFAGLDEQGIQKLYYDEHLNKNGSAFFTRTMMPAILQVYAENVKQD